MAKAFSHLTRTPAILRSGQAVPTLVQYSQQAGSVNQALGRPMRRCGDTGKCMDTAVGTTVPDWLEVRFGTAVRPWRFSVYMSAQPEALRRIGSSICLVAARALPPHWPWWRAVPMCWCCCKGMQHRARRAAPTTTAWPWLGCACSRDGWEAVDAVSPEGFAETKSASWATVTRPAQ